MTIQVTRRPHEVLRSRKDEITPQGHASYDADMFDAYTSARSCDYLAFANTASLDTATHTLGAFLLREHAGECPTDQSLHS